jgi:hypothetical protein
MGHLPAWGSGKGLTTSHCKKLACYELLQTASETEGKGSLGGPRYRWEDNIRMDLREIGWEGVEWIRLAWDKDQWWDLGNMVMNLKVP